MGRNYITRMIVRRAARFGSKIGLNEPFMADVAQVVIFSFIKGGIGRGIGKGKGAGGEE